MAVGDRIKVALETDVSKVQAEVDAGALEIVAINETLNDPEKGNSALKADVDALTLVADDHEVRLIALEGGSSTAKSVIIDVADTHSTTDIYMAVRSIDFYKDGGLIALTELSYSAYATSTVNDNFLPKFAFDTSLSKVGGFSQASWESESGATTDQRLIVVFNQEQEFDEIVINNTHHNGTETSKGFNNIVISSSTDAITDTTYNATIPNSAVLFTGIINEHVASNVVDAQSIPVEGGAPDTSLTDRVDVLEADVEDLQASSLLDYHAMSRGILSNYTIGGSSIFTADTVIQSIYTKSVVLTTDGYGIYVPAGYMVKASGLMKLYSSSSYIGFKIYRESTAIGVQGADTTSSTDSSLYGGGGQCLAFYKETEGATYYLRSTTSGARQITYGNSNTPASYFAIEATKY